jgi:predicted nucleic acid-binding protein
MIATDTSSLSAYFKGEAGVDIDAIASALAAGGIVLPPAVQTELLSDPAAAKEMAETIANFPLLPIVEGYWQRAGEARRLLKRKGHKAKVADALIAQSCIDHDVALITRDADFRHFAKHCGLRLA